MNDSSAKTFCDLPTERQNHAVRCVSAHDVRRALIRDRIGQVARPSTDV